MGARENDERRKQHIARSNSALAVTLYDSLFMDCKVSDCDFYEQRVLTENDDKVEKHIVPLNEEKGGIPFVE